MSWPLGPPATRVQASGAERRFELFLHSAAHRLRGARRAGILERAADLVEANTAEFMALAAREAGKTPDNAQADPDTHAGKAETAGEASEACTQSLRRGSGDGMYTRETRATREAPRRGAGITNRRPVRDRPGAWGWRRGP